MDYIGFREGKVFGKKHENTLQMMVDPFSHNHGSEKSTEMKGN